LESAFTRMLAVAQFYHFAFLSISLALLGFGASGSILTIMERRANTTVNRLECNRILAIAGIGFSVFVAVSYGVVNFIPFDSFTIAWEPHQILFFFLNYLSLTIPFIFAGLGIGCLLTASRGQSHIVYAANLIGSAIGVLLAPILLFLAGVPGAVLFSIGIGLFATLISGSFGKKWLSWGIGVVIGLILLSQIGLVLTNEAGKAPLGMTLSPYKGLAQALHVPGARRLFGRWNAISRVDVVAGASIHQFPGLSYLYSGGFPEQLGISIDGDSLLPISLVNPIEFEAADYLPEAIVFRIKPGGHALVLEPGGGLGILQAIAGGIERITAVLGNPLISQAVGESTPTSNIYDHPAVSLRLEMPRVYLQQSKEQFDIVFLPLTDTYRPVTNGAFSLSETYLLSTQAFEAMLERLAPDGILVTSRWLQTPPSEETRLIATLILALESKGIAKAGQALVAWRGINTMTVMAKPEGWSPAELAQIRGFLDERRFDLVWAPNIQAQEINRYNILPEPVYHQAVVSLLNTKERDEFLVEYPYSIAPIKDNRPFFYHFFSWKQTPALLAAFGHTWQPFGGSGFFVLLALLALVGLSSLVFIVVPLLVKLPNKTDQEQKTNFDRSAWQVLVYFGCLGIGFLFVEIPMIQRWILLLGHPTYAFSGVVFVLLVFSSIGSLLARRWWGKQRWVFGCLVIMALITPWLTGFMTDLALTWSFQWRVLAGALSLAPLAILMGMPFPFGLVALEMSRPALIAWAWAVNGCASVIASVLATILALTWGFQLVLIGGAFAYSLALLALPGQGYETHAAQVGCM
jgi:hypothetical protein